MRTEVKVGLIVGLVAVAGFVIWLFSRPTNELDELPFERAAMETSSPEDSTLASDATAGLPNVGLEDSAAPARASRERATPAPARRTTPVLPPPGEPESPADERIATGPPSEEPSERSPRDAVVEPPTGETGVVEADRPSEAVQRRGPGESQPPEIPAPRRRTSVTGPAPPPRKTYTIQPGDRLIDLAKEEYGDGQLWKAIKAVNPDMDENRLRIGQKIEIPSREEALQLTQPEARAGEAVAAGPPAERPGVRPGPAGRATYVVGQGDSLVKIARNVLNDETRWAEIYELNRDEIASPNLIYPGMELRLPPLEKKPSPADDARG